MLNNKLAQFACSVLTDPKYGWILASCVVFGDALLTQLIIRFIKYTEIDWETYMYHIELYLKGERNYSNITGPTGLLVYPAGHVHIHEILYNITGSGLDIPNAQQIYGLLYILTVVLSCSIYLKAGSIPNWVLLFLPLSKRLHSIYSLRLFNDCWTVFVSQVATLSLLEGYSSVACILFSLAISVKMSALLYIPGLLVILIQQCGLARTIFYVTLMGLFQVILGWPFLSEYPWEYISGAFDLSRIFLFKWTVNWRFVGEETFLSPGFAKSLLIGHLTALFLFAHFKWCRHKNGVIGLAFASLKDPWNTLGKLSPDYMATILMSSNLIGIIFARSLHYQFYSWYAQQIPFLTWRTRYPLPLKLAIIVGTEYAWNVFPSTDSSSGLLVTANVALLVGLWYGWDHARDPVQVATKKKMK